MWDSHRNFKLIRCDQKSIGTKVLSFFFFFLFNFNADECTVEQIIYKMIISTCPDCCPDGTVSDVCVCVWGVKLILILKKIFFL